MIVVEWEFLVEEAKKMGIPLEEMVAGMENDPYYIIVGKPDLCHCGKPEAEHKWISENELTLWRPEPGFKKNSCARRPSSDSPDLVFKVWSPPENPCDSDFMEEISS
jgi:hypothetical protein